MNLLRFLVRAPLVLAWILSGLITQLLAFPVLGHRSRQAAIRGWSRVLLRLCGLRVRAQGEPLRSGAVMWVGNHVSWTDIFVLNAVRTTAFVAKSDIRRWPVIGLLVAWSGTIFLDRGHRQAMREASRAMVERFRQGDAVGLFPEGTTSTGWDVLPFHAGLFEAAVQAEVAVQPVALRFTQAGQRTDRYAFVGEQNLVQNLWLLLGARQVGVDCVFLPPLVPGEGMGRSELARHTQEAIRAAVLRSGPQAG